ncbi:MAG: FAD-dependent oxidoreductase [Desulfuromonadales bacterium]
MSDLLFEPITVGPLEIKNRITMPAMHMNMCRNFEVTDRLVDFYAERALGGAGLIIVGYATVDELSGMPGNIGAHRDEFVPGLARLAEAIRSGGARSAVQINHAGRYNHSFFLGGKKPVAPSAVPSRLTGETPRALELDEIPAMIDRFAQAARRVREAGFDAVEVLTGTGYLISEFLSPLTNERQDAFGGSLENRMRFGLEIVRTVKETVGPDMPVIVRVNGNDFMAGGIGREDLQRFSVALVEAGAAALCVNVGWHEAKVPQIVTKVPRGAFAYLSRQIREKVSVPVIASHRINDPQTARALIADGMCDSVAMGRALIADPQLPNKAQIGADGQILHCVACAQGCFDNLFKMKAVECLCNPRAGHERDRAQTRIGRAQKVMVVGGGAAGMSAALAASEVGHEVTLYERSMRLGGQLLLAGAPPGREEFAALADDLGHQLEKQRVRVVLNSEVTEDFVAAEKPDSVILATGGESATPSIPGVDLSHVVQAWQVLAGEVETGRKVAVVGGGAVGVETALMLAESGTLSGEELKFLLVHHAEPLEDLLRMATRGSKEVVLVEMIDRLGSNFGKSTRWGMMQDVKRFDVGSRMEANVLEITEGGLRLEREGRIEDLEADTVVLAVGTRAHNPLQKPLAHLGIPCRVVGDAHQPAMAFDAIHQGFEAGRGLG